MDKVTYKQGMTVVYVDKEKIVIENPTGPGHVKDNVEQIFGMGEYHKIFEVKLVEDKDKTNRNYTLISGYIPQRALDDLADINEEPKSSASDLMKEYFK